MDPLLLLVGSVLSRLHAVFGAPICPGEWAWTTSLFGGLVGLLPGLGAIIVAWLRLRNGAAYPRFGLTVPTVGVLSCGLLPWLLFDATGTVVRAARFGGVGLAAADRSSLATASCLGVSQRAYLGSVSVSEALGDGGFRAALLVVPLIGFPFVVAFLVSLQARAALRRGPKWPSRFFWLPVLVVALFTGPMPAGATAHLWLGMLGGASAGLFAVLLVPPPARPPARSVQPPPTPVRPAAASPGPVPVGGQPGGQRATAASRAALTAAAGTLVTKAEAAKAWAATAWTAGAAAARRLADRAPSAGTRADWREWWLGHPDPAVPPPPRSGQLPASLAARPGPVPAHSGPGTRMPPTRVESAPPDGRRFELIRELGSGGFGGVWLAVDHRTGQRVAVKAALAPDPDTELRIRREARALASVRHPNCVRILDLVDSQSDPGLSGLRGLVIVMEYVDGQSLGDLVALRGPVDDVSAARIWLHTAGALAAAHQGGVLHRDVKPSNIVLGPRGEPHLIDFGIARARGDMTLTSHGMVIGTPDFLSPETARGDPATPSSDAWQLAATISFALTGVPPRGDHPDAVAGLRAAISLSPTHLPAHSAHRQLLAASLATEPAARPSLDEVRHALDWWLSGQQVGKSPSGPVLPQARRTYRATLIE